MSTNQTFMDDMLAGRASNEDLDDRVDAWHSLAESDPRSKLELHEYLGLSWHEYKFVGGTASKLKYAVAARRSGEDVESVAVRENL